VDIHGGAKPVKSPPFSYLWLLRYANSFHLLSTSKPNITTISTVSSAHRQDFAFRQTPFFDLNFSLSSRSHSSTSVLESEPPSTSWSASYRESSFILNRSCLCKVTMARYLTSSNYTQPKASIKRKYESKLGVRGRENIGGNVLLFCAASELSNADCDAKCKMIRSAPPQAQEKKQYP